MPLNEPRSSWTGRFGVWAWLLASAVAAGAAIADEAVTVTSIGSSIGVRSFSAGRWGLVRVAVLNESPEPAMIRAVVNLKDTPDLRFGRDVWVPARSTRTTSIPIHVGSELRDERSVEIVGRVLLGAEMSANDSSSNLGIVLGEDATVLIQDDPLVEPEGDLDPREKDPAYEVVLAMRASRNFSRTLIRPSERLLPATVQGWDAVRHVVVAGDRLTSEAGAAASLRQWVNEGGRMWVQLNRTDPETLAVLFGSTLGLEVIDRVPLNQFEVKDAKAVDQPTVAAIDAEEPIELIRAWVEGGEVAYRVDGWPAAVQFPYGRGSVIVTLLDAHGWMRPRDQRDPAEYEPMTYTDFMPLEPLDELADRMYQPREEAELDRDVFASYVADRIGYRIPGRGAVLGILGLFCLSILVAGTLLVGRQQLEYLPAVAVVACLLAAAVLVSLGRSSRGDVPATLAELRVVSVNPQTGSASGTGSFAIYQPDQMRADFSGRGLRIDPQMPDLGGQIRQWIWSDAERWRWDETRLPPGVRVMWGESDEVLGGAVRAQASLGPEGFEGVVTLEGITRRSAGEPGEPAPPRIEDALVLFPRSPPLATTLTDDGRFLSGEGDMLATGQYTSATLLTDEQRRRAAVLESWFAGRRDSVNATGPVVLAWVENGRKVFDSQRPLQRTETSLLTIPLTLVRTAPDTLVSIPASAVAPRAILGELGQSSAFDNQTASWNHPNTRPTETRLRFQLPPSVLPIRLDMVRLTLDCHLPSRPLEVFVVRGKERLSVLRQINASGTIRVEVTDPAWLTTDPLGGVILDIAVGDLRSDVDEVTIANSGWSIRSSRLTAAGKTLPEEGESDQ